MLLKDDGRTLALRIDAGEDVMAAFGEALAQSGARALFVASAVGACSEVVFGVYSLETDSFTPDTRSGFLEIVSLSGNVLWRGGKPAPHIHMICSNPDLTLMGGHVLGATCGLTVEVALVRVEAGLKRDRIAGKPASYMIED